MSSNSSRGDALKWWKGVLKAEQEKWVEKWRRTDGGDTRKEWPFELIAMSSSTIEAIWKQMIKP